MGVAKAAGKLRPTEIGGPQPPHAIRCTWRPPPIPLQAPASADVSSSLQGLLGLGAAEVQTVLDSQPSLAREKVRRWVGVGRAADRQAGCPLGTLC